MAPKAAEDSNSVRSQVEENDEGVLDLFLGLDQASDIDEQISVRDYLENVDQSKFGSGVKGLQSQKSVEMIDFQRQ